MKKIDFVMSKTAEEDLKKIVISARCPHHFGLEDYISSENGKCDVGGCEKCWKEEVRNDESDSLEAVATNYLNEIDDCEKESK